ncbi:MAG: Flp1 family type IVb pilin [Clostridia bacterium]
MLKVLKGLIVEEDGISTVEIVVIIAILVGVALLFRKSITAYVQQVINNFIDTAPTVENVEVNTEAPLPTPTPQ